MTYVVADAASTVAILIALVACPVKPFVDDDMLVINPETCIDCDACVPECPVEAVFGENKVPADGRNLRKLIGDDLEHCNN